VESDSPDTLDIYDGLRAIMESDAKEDAWLVSVPVLGQFAAQIPSFEIRVSE
jgi:hypothetical protein